MSLLKELGVAPSKNDGPVTVAYCERCRLKDGCQSPKMPAYGRGTKKILIVGEAPGQEEDRQGRPFVGPAGQVLRKFLGHLGVDLDEDCWTVNAARCRPPRNELPPKAVDYCRGLTVKDIRTFRPRVLILLGAVAVKSVLGWLWKPEPGPIGRWVGWRIPSQELNAWVCPTYHPSYVAREESPVLDLFFARHLQEACAFKNRPWPADTLNNTTRVEILLDPAQATKGIDQYRHNSFPIAFDLETTSLKPDHPERTIYSASISDGSWTIAFPWEGEAIEAMKCLLISPIPKIGWNIKYEHRWIRKKLRINVKHWVFDGMLASHLLDHRDAVNSLKFQAFVRLGQKSYDDEVKHYLDAPNNNQANRIAEMDRQRLLHYNGLDSLLTYQLAEILAKEVGVRW